MKRVVLESLGELVAKPSWCNAGYIFPLGYSALVEYKDILDPMKKIPYSCQITEHSGSPWFKVTSPTVGTSFVGKSPTACWKQVLDRINETLRKRGAPAVRTQVAGPEYFGLNDPHIVESIEQLDTDKYFTVYWNEKENILKAREVYEQNHPRTERKMRKKRRNEEEELDPPSEDSYAGSWSSILRKERYLNRLASSGQEVRGLEDDSPLPEYQDPITLQIVVLPTLSPYGHVAGYYSWVKALKQSNGLCPFTKLPLAVEELIKLTRMNFGKYQQYMIE